jgi:hypothetical protein
MAILMPGRKLRNLPMRLVKPRDVIPLSEAPAFRAAPSSGQQPFDTLRRGRALGWLWLSQLTELHGDY